MKKFTIGELTKHLGCAESMIRKLLNDSGADIDELAQDPGETVPREIVINLVADQAGNYVDRKLAELLA